jgi:hypothetical protein
MTWRSRREHRPGRRRDARARERDRRIVYTHGGLVVETVAGGTMKTISIPTDRSIQGEAPPAWQPR